MSQSCVRKEDLYILSAKRGRSLWACGDTGGSPPGRPHGSIKKNRNKGCNDDPRFLRPSTVSPQATTVVQLKIVFNPRLLEGTYYISGDSTKEVVRAGIPIRQHSHSDQGGRRYTIYRQPTKERYSSNTLATEGVLYGGEENGAFPIVRWHLRQPTDWQELSRRALSNTPGCNTC